MRAGGNRFLAVEHEATHGRVKGIRFLGNEAPAKWQATAAEHEAMITALETRDGDRLAAVLTQHLERTWDRVKDGLA